MQMHQKTTTQMTNSSSMNPTVLHLHSSHLKMTRTKKSATKFITCLHYQIAMEMMTTATTKMNLLSRS